MKHVSFPKIPQFRTVVTNIGHQITYVGQDENGDPIYDPSIPKPKLTFKGTVKLHGTNSGVSYNGKDGLYAQSRENIITVEKDNAGFAFFVHSNEESFMTLINKVIEDNGIDTDVFTVSIYGEWAGKGIQKGVAISEIDKSMFIFGAKISKPGDPDFVSYWVSHEGLRDKDNRIYNILDYKTYEVEVDFTMPALANDQFEKIVNEVEAECPVAKEFGHSGLGEGVVWDLNYKGVNYRFKTKGAKHSASKVKKVASVDVEKLNSIKEFVDYSVTESRFNQAIEKVFGDQEIDVKKMGDFIRWMVNDITSEEMDTMKENSLEPKDVNKYISNKAREMFFKEYNNF